MKTLVFTSKTEVEAYIVKGYLEENGITVVVDTGKDSLGHTTNTLISQKIWDATHYLFVSDTQAEQAQKLIVELQNN